MASSSDPVGSDQKGPVKKEKVIGMPPAGSVELPVEAQGKACEEDAAPVVLAQMPPIGFELPVSEPLSPVQDQ